MIQNKFSGLISAGHMSFYTTHKLENENPILRSYLTTQVITQIWSVILFSSIPKLASAHSIPYPLPVPFPIHQPILPTHRSGSILPLLQPFNHVRLHQESNERRSLVKTGATPFTSNALTWTTVLTITDSLSEWYPDSENWYIASNSLWGLILVTRNYPLHLLLCPASITITSTRYKHHQKTSQTPLIFYYINYSYP